jgi:hypothetical protein
MIRVLFSIALLCVCAACSSDDQQSQSTSQAKQVLDRAASVAERPVSKQELMGLLSSAGLNPSEKPALRISNDMEDALPEQPRDHFMLGIDGEGMVAFEFATVDAAQKMDAAHDKGFRYRNWYFGGIVSTAVTEGMKSAFE